MKNIIIDNAQKLCSDCWQKQFQIELKLWEEEQRREVGPDWEGVPTRKKMAFKKPISMPSTKSEVAASSSSSFPRVDNVAAMVGAFYIRVKQ